MRFISYALFVLMLVSCGEKKEKQVVADQRMVRGKAIYDSLCITCHLSKGEGVTGAFPPLANSDYLLNKRTESIRAVKYGQQGEILVNGVTYNSVMTPLGLTDQEVADVMNYILNSWGNTTDKKVTVAEVAAVKKE